MCHSPGRPSVPTLVPRTGAASQELLCTFLFKWPIQGGGVQRRALDEQQNQLNDDEKVRYAAELAAAGWP